MTFTDAVYLAALIEAVLFFAAGYMFRSSRAAVRAQAQVPNQPEVGVEELIRELEREPSRQARGPELAEGDKSAVDRRLIEVPGYTYRIFVTSRDEDPVTLWRDYNQRACVEQRIKELKNDLAADGFCMKQFFATEAAFLSVLFAFNLLSLYQQATGTRSEKHYPPPPDARCAGTPCCPDPGSIPAQAAPSLVPATTARADARTPR